MNFISVCILHARGCLCGDMEARTLERIVMLKMNRKVVVLLHVLGNVCCSLV
jgi:hypothetical protein